jgi:hypothetical protein
MSRIIKQFLGLAILILAFSLQGCVKTDNLPQLEVLVQNESGTPVAGAYVAIFDNLDEWNKRTNPVQTWRTTNSEGKVLFTDLSEDEYFVYVRFDGKDNSLAEISTFGLLVMNQKTQIVIHIR